MYSFISNSLQMLVHCASDWHVPYNITTHVDFHSWFQRKQNCNCQHAQNAQDICFREMRKDFTNINLISILATKLFLLITTRSSTTMPPSAHVVLYFQSWEIDWPQPEMYLNELTINCSSDWLQLWDTWGKSTFKVHLYNVILQ